MADAASAETIDYIFTGAGSWTLDGTAMDGSFTLTYVSDTSTVVGPAPVFTNFAAGTFVSGATVATLTGNFNEVIVNQTAPAFVGFGQITSSPFNAAGRGLINSAFETYDLSTAFPLTNGVVSAAESGTFHTSVGDLVFGGDSIDALQFQAVIFPLALIVPEAPTWAMLLAAFAGLGLLGYRQTVKARVAA